MGTFRCRFTACMSRARSNTLHHTYICSYWGGLVHSWSFSLRCEWNSAKSIKPLESKRVQTHPPRMHLILCPWSHSRLQFLKHIPVAGLSCEHQTPSWVCTKVCTLNELAAGRMESACVLFGRSTAAGSRWPLDWTHSVPERFLILDLIVHQKKYWMKFQNSFNKMISHLFIMSSRLDYNLINQSI